MPAFLLNPRVLGAIAIGLVILGLGLAVKVQTARLNAAQANLEACKSRYDEALAQIAKQNAAVIALKTTSDAAQKRAQEALAKAARGRVVTQTEQARLQAAAPAIKAIPQASCPAGAAVAEVRKGLSK